MLLVGLTRRLFDNARQCIASSAAVTQRRNYEAFNAKFKDKMGVLSVVPGSHHQSAKIIFDDNRTADFKYIWLRDNCKCPKCVDQATQQKLLDSPSIDVNIRPERLNVSSDGHLLIEWTEKGQTHKSLYDADWYELDYMGYYIRYFQLQKNKLT